MYILPSLLVSATLAGNIEATGSPVSRVVELVRQLKSTIEADGKTEQQIYDKLACWCEETTNRKTDDIETATNRIDELSQLIQENSGKSGIFSAEIAQLKKDIAANEVNRKEATEIRQKQNEEYTKERLETEQCISALEHATKVLTGAGTSSLQEARRLSVVKGIDVALEKLPIENSISGEQKQLLSSFVEDARKSSFLQASHNPFGDYAPQSTQIQGILKNMYDTFVAALERANGEESTQNQTFKDLIKTKKEEFETLTATLTQKQTAFAENVQTLAEQKLERSNLQEQKATDKKFLEETKNNCRDQADSWSERSRLRTEELGGIDKAIDILSSNEDLFARSNKDFIQMRMLRPQEAITAYRKLSALAQRHDSMRFAALAVKVKAGGHFDDVIKIIDVMIGTIRDEDGEDIASKKRCTADFEALKSENGDLDHYQMKNRNLIALLGEQNAELQKKLGETEAEIVRVQQEIDDALEERTEAKQEFNKALQDDKDASKVIGKAVEALSAFYENNKIGFGLVQEPTYSVDQDKAPEGFAGKPYGGKKSESTGIVAILKMLKEDVDNEIKESITAEAEAQKDFEETRDAARANVKALKETKTNLTQAKAKNEENNSNAENEKQSLNELQGSNGGSFDSHCGECQWIYSNASAEFSFLKEKCGPKFTVSDVASFDTRKKLRSDELQGLQDARASLAGSAQDPASS